MKVLQIYAGNLFGGVERLLVALATETSSTSSLGRHFALCFHERLWDELQSTSALIHDLGHTRISRPWTLLRARHRLAHLLGREKYDVAICHSYWPMAVFGGVVRRHRVPLVFWAHDAPDGTQWIETLARRVKPDRIIANSRFTASRVATMYPGIECDVRYHPLRAPPKVDRAEVRSRVRRALGVDDSTCVIVITARLESWKGHRLLLNALSKLRDLPGWECWIAGGVQRPIERDYLDELHRLAGSGAINSRVRFLGQRSDVDDVLVSADIHCQPNEGPEPFGVAFIEAMHRGLPVVTTRMGGGDEIVDSTCGVLIEPGDVDALARELTRLIEDPDRRARLGRAAPERADAICNPERNLAAIEELLHRTSESVART
jgi:glycosyltransferase involved in cell wall biosynthesis